MTAGATVRVSQLWLIAVLVSWHLPAGADDADGNSAARRTASVNFQQPQRQTDEAHDRALLQQLQRLLPARERSKLAVAPVALSAQQAAVFRSFVAGSWQDFDVSNDAALASAPGEAGACTQPGSDRYSAGLNSGDGCLQITMTDGGPNDLDGVVDGVIRQAGGLAVPTSADIFNRDLNRVTTLRGSGNIAVARFSLQSDSGGTVLRSVTIAASGSGDETRIDNVLLVIDVDGNGRLTRPDVILATGAYTLDDGNLTLPLTEPFDVPPGATEMLVVYELLDAGDQ